MKLPRFALFGGSLRRYVTWSSGLEGASGDASPVSVAWREHRAMTDLFEKLGGSFGPKGFGDGTRYALS